MTSATRQAAEKGHVLLLNGDNLNEIAARHRDVPISRKVDNVLRFLATQCKNPGFSHIIDFNFEYPLVDCTTPAEMLEYAKYLGGKHLISCPDNNNWSLTIDGWKLLEPTMVAGGEPDRCFVAMWFDDTLDDAYANGFAKAIGDCGFKAYRVKEDPTNKAIIDRILSEIRRAHFIVANATGHRQSVYYEAGFAAGLGREVVWCCRADHLESEERKLAFDTRHLGHVVWQSPEDLRVKLANSIRANIIPSR